MLADALERLAAEGPAPFYTGDVAAAVCDWIAERGGLLTRDDLAAYATVPRVPVRVRYRGADVVTNPPPSAGGVLLGHALALLERSPPPPTVAAIVEAMAAAQAERTPGVPRRACPTRASSSASWRAGWARRRTSRSPTPTAGRAR